MQRDDLTCHPAGRWLWRLPWAAIAVGAFWSAGRLWLWIPSFFVAGVACLVNARRCGRRHCYVTGPLYLGAAFYLVAAGLGRLPLDPSWFLVVVIGASVLAQVAERPLGRYRALGTPGTGSGEAGR